MPLTKTEMEVPQMADYIVKDFPHYTVNVLLTALERSDRQNLRVCSQAVLRSTFNHLFLSDYTHPDTGTGMAMSTLLVLFGSPERRPL